MFLLFNSLFSELTMSDLTIIVFDFKDLTNDSKLIKEDGKKIKACSDLLKVK